MANFLNLVWMSAVGSEGAASVPNSTVLYRTPIYLPFGGAGKTVAEGPGDEIIAEFVANIAGSATVTATIAADRDVLLSSTIAGSATITAVIESGEEVELSSTLAGSSTVAADLAVETELELTGTLAGSATVSAALFATTSFPPTEGRPTLGQLWPR